MGTTTDAGGNFTLSYVKPGKYDLVISFVGFEPYHQPIVVGGTVQNLGNMELHAKSIVLREVRVGEANNVTWQRNYQWFKESLLGTNSLAKTCKIVNPDVLDLIYHAKTDSLTATADDFLLIENNALGYRIKYLIAYFFRCDSGRRVSYKGYPLFEKLKGTPAQEARWVKNRRKAYEGSSVHFLRAGIANRLDDEGFRVFQYAIYANPHRPADSLIRAKITQFSARVKLGKGRLKDSLTYWKAEQERPAILHQLLNFPLAATEFIKRTSQAGTYALTCDHDGLYIIFSKAHHFPKNGAIDLLNSPYNNNSTLLNFNTWLALFDTNGWFIDPDSVMLTGVWTQNRTAGLLPIDYDPTE